MTSSLVNWLLLVVPGIIWGASFLFIAEGLTAMAPNGVTFTRIAIGFLTLSLFPSARRPVARADWAGTAALGVLWLAFPLSMFPFAEQHVSTALTGMLNGAMPLFAAVVASVCAVLAVLAVGSVASLRSRLSLQASTFTAPPEEWSDWCAHFKAPMTAGAMQGDQEK